MKRSVSVIVPNYNAGPYLPTTLQSVFAQTGFELDVIVVDDGSTDGSADAVARRFPQVRVVRQANQGVAVARNTGLAEARHDWVAFIDADDIWLPGKLDAQWQALAAQPDARMAYAAWQVWPSTAPAPEPELTRHLLAEAEGSRPGATGWIYPELLVDCVVWTSTVLAQRSLLQALKGFDPALRVGEDYDLWLRASRITPILRVARPLALYRIHDDNITRRVPARNYKGEVIGSALQRWGYASPEGRMADRRRVNAGLAHSWATYAGMHVQAGNPAAAMPAAIRALKADLRLPLAWKVLLKAALGRLRPSADA